ncbi:MAG: hypothetical protein Q8N96_15330 [Methylovulum sp.]|nr:hypothetical protein [Methylovulum sp.]
MMLKFTANLSLLFTEAELIDRFKAAKQHGFNGVEIQFPYSLSAESIRTALEENGLQLSCSPRRGWHPPNVRTSSGRCN